MGPCDDELGSRDECGECALEAQHLPGPCAWICHYCGGRGCSECEGGLLFDEEDEER